MAYYVNKGAKLKCSMGSDQSGLEVMHPTDKVLLCGQPMANIMDYKPMVNVKPFGQCQSLANPTVAAATAANYGRLQKMPCIPNVVAPWLNGKMNLLIKGSPALLDCSKCMCVWAGVIEVADPGQKTVKEGGPMTVTAKNDEGSSASESSKPSSDSAKSQNSGATAAAGNAVLGKLLIRGVIGKSEAFSGDIVEYEVSGYNRDKSSVSEEEKSRIKWGVMCDGRIEEQNGIRGEAITLEIKDIWLNKEISVMACMEGFNMNVCQKTKVKRLLVKEVKGVSKSFSGDTVTYSVTAYTDGSGNSIDPSFVSEGAKRQVRWAVNVDGNTEELIDGNGRRITGDTINIEMASSWLNRDIRIMPYVEHFDENVSQNTNVGDSGTPRFVEMYWSYGSEHIKIETYSKYYEDMNLHVKTKNYNKGDVVEFTVKRNDGEPLCDSCNEIKLYGVVDENNEVIIDRAFEKYNLNLNDSNTSDIDPKRPRWIDVYNGYPLVNRGTQSENDLPSEQTFKSVLEDNSDNRAMFNNFSKNAGTTRLSIALIRAGMTLKKDFKVQVGDLKGKGFIASAINMIKWLSEPEQFGKADIIIKSPGSFSEVSSKIGNKKGIYAFESNDYKRASGVTTLWHNGNAIGGNNSYDLAKEIHFWELK